MLDTNVVSHLLRGDRPELPARLAALPVESVLISAVTEAEMLFGLARRCFPP